jgi:hypothetical protein
VTAARWEVGHDDRRVARLERCRVVAETADAARPGDVELAVLERETMGRIEALGDRDDGVGTAVAVPVGQGDDAAPVRARDEQRASGIGRHEPCRAEARRKLLDPEARWEGQARFLPGCRPGPDEERDEEGDAQRPCHRGLRLSRKARTPSWKSSLK